MQNFDLFEKALKNYEKIEQIRTDVISPHNNTKQEKCNHNTTESHHGICTCTICGEIV